MPKFDERVNETQMWLNVTYEKNPKWSHVEMDGKTGWPTIRGLIRALQIEIGISGPNGYFGPATEAACPTLRKNLDSKDKRLQRLVYILQGAMWCKGFSPGGFTGTFGPKTEEGVKKFQQSAGLSGSEVNGIVDKKTFKALLNMDAYVLVPEGDPKIREIQKNLNRDYYKWIGLRPTDGRYARDTCKALIYALQVEGGVSGPNGVFGPGTQASLPVLAPGSKNADYVRILQYCLYCNGFDPTGFTGVFGNGTLATLKKFQSFHGLTPDGYCGKQTWMSLLLSHGDRDRKGQAFDCATPLNQARINTLKAHGYKYAGRYIAGGESKRVTVPEIELILKNNMKWFPIFQKSGNHLSYFNSIQGNLDATECLINAKEYKIPSGSTIYFAVDFDAMDGEVSSNILPYFSAIQNTFRSNNPRNYKIGVYGARNICSRVSNAGYAETSFVGDLASGFSGNLGYPLPKNWAFDQIKEYTIGSGDGAIAIDNDLYSGRDSGIDHLSEDVIYPSREMVLNQFKEILSMFNIVADGALNCNYEQVIHIPTMPLKAKIRVAPKALIGSGVINFDVNNKLNLLDDVLYYLSDKNILGHKLDLPALTNVKNNVGSIAHDGNKVLIAGTYDKDLKQFGVKVQVEINAARIDGVGEETLCMSIGLFPDDKEIQEAIKVITESASDAAPYALAAIAIIILGLISGEIVAGGLVISEVIATLSAWVVAILQYFKLVTP